MESSTKTPEESIADSYVNGSLAKIPEEPVVTPSSDKLATVGQEVLDACAIFKKCRRKVNKNQENCSIVDIHTTANASINIIDAYHRRYQELHGKTHDKIQEIYESAVKIASFDDETVNRQTALFVMVACRKLAIYTMGVCDI